MPCTRIGNAIVCTETRRCTQCKRPARLLCDWKLKADGTPFARGSCNAPICESCTTKPAPGKDLCPAHRESWKRWRASIGAPA